MRRYAGLLTTRPWIGLASALLVTAVLAAGLPRIGFDMNPNETFQASNQASENLSRLHAVFGPDDNDVVVIVEGEGLLEWESLQALRRFRDAIESIPGVEWVGSIFDLNKPGAAMPLIPVYATDRFDAERLRQQLQRHPVAANQLISADGTLLNVLVRMRGGSLSVAEVSRVMQPLMQAARQYETDTGAKVHLAGHPAIRVDVLETLRWAMVTGCLGAVGIGFVIALLVFRHLPSVILAVLAPAIGVAWVMGLLAWQGVAVSGLITALPNLAFIIGLTDAVHLLLEAQRELHRGESQRQAVFDALVKVGPACLLTTLTTVLGFGSLTLSRTESVQAFGLWAALGTALALLAVLLILPTALLVIPRSWATSQRTERNRLGRWVRQIVQPALVYPRLTACLAITLCLALLYPALRQRPDIMWTETMPRHSDSVLAMERADAEFGGAMLAYMIVRWPESVQFPDREILQVAAEIHGLFQSQFGFTGPFSIRNLMAATPGRSLDERYRAIEKRIVVDNGMLISESDRSLLVSARIPNDGSSALADRLDALAPRLQALRQQHPEYEFTLTGTAVAAAENMAAIITDLARSLGFAAVLILVVLAIAFRSPRIGLLTVVPNLFPLLVTAAGLSLLGMPLQITSVMTFSLCLGLAVDDTIHVIVRYRMNLQSHSDCSAAIDETVTQVGPALIVTTAILLGGFAAMMVSPMPAIQLFAALSAVTLLFALIGDLVFFPALLLWAAVGRRGAVSSGRRLAA